MEVDKRAESDALNSNTPGIDSVINIEVIVNSDISVHLRLLNSMQFSDVHTFVCKAIMSNEFDANYEYSFENKSITRDNLTCEQIGLRNECSLSLVQPLTMVQRKLDENRRLPSKSSNQDLKRKRSDFISVTVVFAFYTSKDVTSKRIRVWVNPDDSCSDLIDDISEIFGNKNLKFKAGKCILNHYKTFNEARVKDGSQIYVTQQ